MTLNGERRRSRSWMPVITASADNPKQGLFVPALRIACRHDPCVGILSSGRFAAR